jgi:hypothetical protein
VLVSVDAVLEALVTLGLADFEDPVALHFVRLRKDDVAIDAIPGHLCDAGVPAARARAVKTALKARTATPPASPVRTRLSLFLHYSCNPMFCIGCSLLLRARKRAAKLRLLLRCCPVRSRFCVCMYVCVCA